MDEQNENGTLTTEELLSTKPHFDIKNMIITSLICLAPAALGIIFKDKLPDPFPIHYDAEFNPNGFMKLNLWTLISNPVIFTAVNLILFWAGSLDKTKKSAFGIALIGYILGALSIATEATLVLIPLGFDFMDSILMIVIGLILVVLGNFLPKLPVNAGGKELLPSVNAQTWWKRLVSKLYVAAGFLVLITAFIPLKAKWLVFTAIIVIGVLLPFAFIHSANKNHC